MIALQELCLNQIILNLDKHFSAYCTLNNLKPQYEVLRRRFSVEILKKLENHVIPAEYIDFLVNKYIKSLHTKWLQSCSLDVIEKKFAEIGPNLEKVHFWMNIGYGRGNGNEWDIFCHLSNLKEVVFTYCDERILRYVAKFCPRVEFINLGFFRTVTNNGFKCLFDNERGLNPCPDLKEIKFHPNSVNVTNDKIMQLIKNSQSLEKVHYKELGIVLYKLHKNDHITLDKIKPYNLTDINIKNMFWTGRVSDEVANEKTLEVCTLLCPHLKSFSAYISKQEHLCLLSQLTELQHLSITNYKDSPMELNDFLKSNGNKLSSIKVCNFSLSVAHLSQNCPNLNSLELKDMKYQNNGGIIPMFDSLNSISFINIKNIDTHTAETLKSFLSSLPSLQWLIFRKCDLSSPVIKTGIFKCCEYGTIKHISFARSTVSTEFAHDVLLAFSVLETLNIKYSSLEVELQEIQNIALERPNRPHILHRRYQNFKNYENVLNYFSDSNDEFGLQEVD